MTITIGNVRGLGTTELCLRWLRRCSIPAPPPPRNTTAVSLRPGHTTSPSDLATTIKDLIDIPLITVVINVNRYCESDVN
jgi:hypothetical protein